jgi:hypothetical protein
MTLPIISLLLSIFSLGYALYVERLVMKINRRLILENWKLHKRISNHEHF